MAEYVGEVMKLAEAERRVARYRRTKFQVSARDGPGHTCKKVHAPIRAKAKMIATLAVDGSPLDTLLHPEKITAGYPLF